MKITSDNSLYVALSGSSQQVTITSKKRKFFVSSNLGAYLAAGSNPTASAGNGSIVIPPNFAGSLEFATAPAKIAVLQLGSGGVITIVPGD